MSNVTSETQFETIAKSISSMKEQLEALGQPVYGLRETGTSLSYMTEDNSSQGFRAKAVGPWGNRGRRALPKGYVPKSAWQSQSEFLREGIRAFNQEKGSSSSRRMAFEEKYKSVWKAVQGMSEGVGSEGGFSVLPEFSPEIHDRVYENSIFGMTDNYTVTGNGMRFPRNAETSRATGSRSGGITAYWVGEGTAATASAPKLAETELRLKKLMVIVYLTNELIDDNGYALEQWVSRKVQEEIQFMLGNAVFNGTGVGSPLGFTKSPVLITVDPVVGQAADTIIAQNIISMWARRLANAPQEGWAWFMHQSVEAQLALMYAETGVSGGLVYMPPTGLSGRPYGTLQGLPIVTSEFSPTLGDANDICLANLKEYVSISKGGVTEATSTEVEFLTDQLALRFTMRVDGRPYDDSAITPFAAGATTPPTQSAFIGLGAR